MKIIWKTSASGKSANPVKRIDLEYEIRLKVIRILIQEAEHLMDYLSLIVLELDPNQGSVRVHEDTPEPLLSIVQNNLVPDQVFEDSHRPTSQTSVKKALLAIS